MNIHRKAIRLRVVPANISNTIIFRIINDTHKESKEWLEAMRVRFLM